MPSNRRLAQRSSVGFYVDQYVEDEGFRCFSSNVSTGGIYVTRVASPFVRQNALVQMEMNLPGCNESIWTSGAIVYDRVEGLFHGSAVRFVAMARKHERLLQDFLHEQRAAEQELESVALPSGHMVHIRRPSVRKPRVRRSQLGERTAVSSIQQRLG